MGKELILGIEQGIQNISLEHLVVLKTTTKVGAGGGGGMSKGHRGANVKE